MAKFQPVFYRKTGNDRKMQRMPAEMADFPRHQTETPFFGHLHCASSERRPSMVPTGGKTGFETAINQPVPASQVTLNSTKPLSWIAPVHSASFN